MTGKQRALGLFLGVVALFGGGALAKSEMQLGPLLGCLLLLYGTVALLGALTEPGENKDKRIESGRKGIGDKIIFGEGPLNGCLLLLLICVVIGGIGYLEKIRENIGFSIFGVIIIGLIFWGVDRISRK